MSDSHKAAKTVCDGFKTISTSVSNLFGQFQSTMNHLLPKLNADEQGQVINAIGRFSKFLMTTQEFVSSTLIGIRYAETLEHLCTAIPIETIRSLVDEVQVLLEQFHKVQMMVNVKVKEESSLHSFRNIMIGKLLFVAKCLNVLSTFSH